MTQAAVAPLPGLSASLQLQRPDFELDVTLALASQGFSALFGPSGCGKTTCLRALAGLERAHGRVQFNQEVWQDDDRGIWVPPHLRRLAFVFQEASLFEHLNVRANVEFGYRRVPIHQRRITPDQAIDLLGIAPLLRREPGSLSGGERQRVALARALASNPQLILMDEPLSALDSARKADILPYLESLRTSLGIPIVYVTHAIDEVARLADHLVLLEAGRVVAEGATAQLMTRLDLTLAHGDSAGAVIQATVHSHEPEFHLTLADFAGRRLSVARQALAPGSALRVRIQARDVSLTLARQEGSSILNVIPAIVTGIAEDSPGQVMVALDAAGTLMLARVTRKSAVALGLAPGLAVFAQVKGVAILN
ncbi:MAG: molybdenum transporter ATP-binding protein [Pseudomonadota bacterium]